MIGILKPYTQSSVAIHRIVVAAEGGEELENSIHRLSGDVFSEGMQRQLDVVLGRWCMVMTRKPSVTSLAEHEVNTGDSKPIRCVSYRLPLQWRVHIRLEIEELLYAGIVKLSVNHWCSPIVPVAKPGGSVRLSVDYKQLNSDIVLI